MKNKIILYLGICVLLSSCKEEKTSNQNTEAAVVIENKAPELVSDALYQDLEGNSIALEDYKGKRLVLNYWATWCKPCIEEMPAMARAQKLLANENYVFLFASDQSFKKILAFKERRQFGLDFIKFNGAYMDLQITALPVTIIYNEAGEQVERFEGGMVWDTPEMINKLKLLH